MMGYSIMEKLLLLLLLFLLRLCLCLLMLMLLLMMVPHSILGEWDGFKVIKAWIGTAATAVTAVGTTAAIQS